ncbi:SAV_2336 N-terminal domain-related protein [Streptomyces sp. NPDC006553]|uniref:SAV_2336 N-terminal domain-related protein n=1 Tax=unclassified Streptomyces TaxID=2593676 RepID=UPI0022543F95|nr:SAV_2336 N-terminal domain-related protein [Streptomyces sp. NBC_00233]MCX5228627.1 SAV_2336 N-terminal domain-related protein [Streptomyces sp. NBC_00233]
MHRMHLEELTRRLRAGGQDPTAEDVADALWLAQWLPGPTPDQEGREGAEGPPGDPRRETAGDGSADGRDPGGVPGATGGDGGASAGPGGPRESVSLHMATGAAGKAGEAAGVTDGTGSGGTGAHGTGTTDTTHTPEGTGATGGDRRTDRGATLPVRAPGANALPGLLGLQKALRPLRAYALAPHRPGEGVLDEEATAERSAAAGILTPVMRPAAGRRPDIQLLMDTGPAMVVWSRMVEELRQACQQSGAFRDVQVHRLYDTGEGPPLVTTTSGADGRPRLRPVDQLHDPTGRRFTLVVSDCVGPLWQRGAAQRFLRQWPRNSPLALVQPLPPRLWPRTALPAEPGTFQRSATPGGHTAFRSDDEPWGPLVPGRSAVPVLTPTPEAFASWTRLHTGHGGNAVRGWAAWLAPEAVEPRAPRTPRAARSDDDLLRAFRAAASPGALRLAVHLAAAPLTLPVMQLVQRAMLPDTGPMELAEVLLSGLLRRLPGPTPYPCFSYPPGIQQHFLGSLDPSAAALVLKHCSAYVERNFGQGMRNFPALAAARLAGADTETDTGTGDGPGTRRSHGRATDLPEETEATDEPLGPDGPETELFARIPARVLRFYHPDLVTPDPLTEARRLLAQGRAQSDPALLAGARERAEAALPAEPVEARIVLARALYAEAGTAAARRTGRRPELLGEAADTLVRAGELARTGGEAWAESRLELAVVHHALWRDSDETGHLDAALTALAEDADHWPETARPTLHLRRGRLLLARGDGEEAATELTAALTLHESAAALLDLADALHLAGTDPGRIGLVLDRAEPLLGDARALRLRFTTARARLYDTEGDGAAADAAYEEATLLAPADSEQRGPLLLTWGGSLLRRAAAGAGTAPVDRAEGVLREALTRLPAGAPERARARTLIGSVLALRFHRAGFLPDLFESRHVLEQALRGTHDPGDRAEVWLQLGRVRLELAETARDGVIGDALAAYRNAGEDSRAAHGDEPGTVTGARALHAQGAVLVLMGRPARARTVLLAATTQWRRLTGELVGVDWDDVERTRALLAGVESARAREGVPLTPEERRRVMPPWWSWTAG